MQVPLLVANFAISLGYMATATEGGPVLNGAEVSGMARTTRMQLVSCQVSFSSWWKVSTLKGRKHWECISAAVCMHACLGGDDNVCRCHTPLNETIIRESVSGGGTH